MQLELSNFQPLAANEEEAPDLGGAEQLSEPMIEESDQGLASLIRSVGLTSITDIESLVSELQEVKNYLQSEGERIRAETADITTVAIDAYVTDPETLNISNDQFNYGYIGATWLFNKLGGEGNVYYMRGIVGHPADLDRHDGVMQALSREPDPPAAEQRRSGHRTGTRTRAPT